LEDRTVAELAADKAIVDEQWKRYIDGDAGELSFKTNPS